MSEAVHAGGCFCGAIRYVVTGAPGFLCICHCDSCRRAAGAMMVAWGTFSSTAFEITAGRLAELQTSPGVTRGHCQKCGTSLTYRKATRTGEIDVTLASMDDASRLRPTAHIWVEDKLPWIELADGVVQYRKGTLA